MYKKLINQKSDFWFEAIGVENYNSNSSRMRFLFNHLKKNHKKIEGNIYEFGVYNGKTLISIALLLKKLNSKKKVFGFDTFSGFPEYSKFDDLSQFEKMLKNKIISVDQFNKFQLLSEIKRSFNNKKTNVKNISFSNEFISQGKTNISKKLKILKLDNVELIEGDFDTTVAKFFKDKPHKIFSVNIDCDLYEGYKVVLSNIWKRLEKNGYIHLDEYYSLKFPGARKAVNDFCDLNKIKLKKQRTSLNEFERWFLKK